MGLSLCICTGAHNYSSERVGGFSQAGGPFGALGTGNPRKHASQPVDWQYSSQRSTYTVSFGQNTLQVLVGAYYTLSWVKSSENLRERQPWR